MPKERNPKIEEAKALFLKGTKLIDISVKLDIPEGTVRRWKSIYKWGGERSEEKNERSEEKKAEIKIKKRKEELTEKQQLFCLYYVKRFNATKAYQSAYKVKYETAMVEGCKLLRNPKIEQYIRQLKQNKLNKALLEAEDIFQKYMDIAYSDITDYVSFGREEVQVMSMYGPVEIKDAETGKKVPLMKEINSIKFKESTDIDGTLISEICQGKDGTKIRLLDKMKAMQWISDHMSLATEEQRVRIENIKACTTKLKGEEPEEEKDDDGFIDALKGDADIWEE